MAYALTSKNYFGNLFQWRNAHLKCLPHLSLPDIPAFPITMSNNRKEIPISDEPRGSAGCLRVRPERTIAINRYGMPETKHRTAG
jgi:hypothetical protein